MRKVFKILRIVLLAILALPVFCNFVIVFKAKVLNQNYPTMFNIGTSTVITGSMDPAIETGSMVYTVKSNDYKVGDIVTFTSGDSLVTHRIISIDDDEIYTKGDANNVIDDGYRTSEDIVGKVFLIIPKVGYVSLFFKSLNGMIFLFAIYSIIVELSLFPFKDYNSNLDDLVHVNDLSSDKLAKLLKIKDSLKTEELMEELSFISEFTKADYDLASIDKLTDKAEKYFSKEFLNSLDKLFKNDSFIDDIFNAFITNFKKEFENLNITDKSYDNFSNEIKIYKNNIINNLMDIVLSQEEKYYLLKEKGLIKKTTKQKAKA